MTAIEFGREITGSLEMSQSREWLVTNGIGGYASGTVAGTLTRRYHGLLVAASRPPLGRTLLLAKLDETAIYDGAQYALFTNRWADDVVDPAGYRNIESFRLEGAIPVWRFALADALIEKRIWMAPGANTTYIMYDLRRAARPLTLDIKALVNYRDYHSLTRGVGWQMDIRSISQGLRVTVSDSAVPFYVQSDRADVSSAHQWYAGFELPVEEYRGLNHQEDHLFAGTFQASLKPGEWLTIVASTDSTVDLDDRAGLARRRRYEKQILDRSALPQEDTPDWIRHLILAADQFVVDRSLPDESEGRTIIAGYPWFGDWGRDTMISLPGLTLTTGRPEVARAILHPRFTSIE